MIQIPAHLPRWNTLLLRLTLGAILGCLPALSGAVGLQPGATSEHDLKAGGLNRSYRLYLPANYRANAAAPLLLALHGGFGTGKNMEEISALDRVADARGIIVAYPDGIGRAWNAGTCCARPMKQGIDDVAFMRAVVADVARQVNVDRSRVYGAGFSNGAMMMHRVACEAPQTFAAIAAVSGGIMLKDCTPGRGMPTLLIQGRADPRIPWDGGEFDGSYRPSIKDIVGSLGARNGCSTGERVTESNDVVSCRTLTGCRNGHDVQWCGLAGIGHQWPGGRTLLPMLLGKNTDRYDASVKIVDFLLQHRAR